MTYLHRGFTEVYEVAYAKHPKRREITKWKTSLLWRLREVVWKGRIAEELRRRSQTGQHEQSCKDQNAQTVHWRMTRTPFLIKKNKVGDVPWRNGS
jgi:hypothetical protein